MNDTEITLEFSRESYSLSVLQAAAYRLIGTANCRIEPSQAGWTCILEQPSNPAIAAADIRSRFLIFVSDEVMRERVEAKTESVRDLILALAFGGLATGN
jgi:His-Xaa-Ser system protein HxsD